MAADLKIRWHLELVDRASSKLLREDRAIRSSLQQTERAERRLARAAQQSGQTSTRAHSRTTTAVRAEGRAAQQTATAQSRLATSTQRTGAAARGAAGGLRQQGSAAKVAGVNVNELNRAQARALQLTGAVASRSRQVASAYRAQASAAREASAAETTAARRTARSAAGAGAGGFAMGRGGGGALAATGAVAGAAGGIKLFAGFEEQMDRVAAVSQASRREMEQLSAQAIKLGADTRFSAGEAASGMYQLSTAGFRADEVMRAIPGTLSLAAASGTELAEAAEIQAAALRGFGLDAREAGRVADVLTSTVNASAVEMYDLGESLKYIAPVARASGQSMETMMAAVGLMGNVGIKGSQAGTTLRTAMVRLTAPTAKSAAALDDLGIKANELRGPRGLLPLPQIMEKIARGAEGVDKGTRNAALAAIFGREALSGMIALVEQGPQALNRQITALKASEGQAKRTADVMRGNVSGAWDEFTGSVETAAISLTRSHGPQLQATLRGMGDAVDDFSAGLSGKGGGSNAAEFGRDLRGAAAAGRDFVRELRPAGSFVSNVLLPLGQGGGQAALGSLRLIAGAATLAARGLGAIGDAAEDHPALFRAIGVGLTVMAASSPRVLALIGGLGRVGRAARLLLTPLGLVSRAIAAIAAGRGLSAGVGMLARMRAGWRRVAVEATAAGRAQAIAAGGGAAGGRGNRTMATAGTIWAARTPGARGAMAAGGRGLATMLAGAARAAGPAAIGVTLVSGIISGVQSRRADFGGKMQDFLSGATLGIVPGAAQSVAEKVRNEYRGAIDRGLQNAARDVQRGQGFRALERVLEERRRIPLSGGNLFGGNPRTEELNFRDLANRRRQLEAQRAQQQRLVDGARGQRGSTGLSNDLRSTTDELNRVKQAQDRILKDAPRFARLFAGRADLSSLEAMRDLLRSTGREGEKARRTTEQALRSARGSTFQAQSRNLDRGAARSISEIRATMTQANRDLSARGVKAGTADFAARQEQLTSAAVRNIKKLVKDGTITARQGEREMRKILRDAQTRSGQSLNAAARSGVKGMADTVKGWARGWARAGKITDQNVEQIGDTLGKMPRRARVESARAMTLMARTMEQRGALPRGSADRLVFLLQSRFGDLGNIDEPIKDPLAEISRLLGGLESPAMQAFSAIRTLGSGLASMIPPGFASSVAGVASQLSSLSGLTSSLGAIGSILGGNRKGGTIARFQGGGTVPILAAGGEAYVDPTGSRAAMIPGDPRSDSTLIYAQPGARILTGDGIARYQSGESLDSAVATQLPHFAKGGKVRSGKYTSTSYGPPWGGINGTGVTATGVNLKNSPKLYGIAVDPRMIGLGQAPYVWPNPFGYSGRFRAFDTGGAIKGNRIDFYDWRGRKTQMGWGRKRVNVSTQRLTRRRGESGAQYSSPTGRGATPQVRNLGRSKTRGGLLDDAWGQGYSAGQGGLTSDWIRRSGNPIIRAIIEEQAGAAERADAASRYRAPRSSGSESSTGGGGGTVAALKAVAARTRKPYVWGGGHGGFRKNPGGLDCSGYVSHVLRFGGAKPTLKSPVTTDGTAVYGRSGPGKRVTIHTRRGGQAHTVLTIDGAGYSSGNRRTGRLSGRHNMGAAYLRTLPIKRHPDGLRHGGRIRRFRAGGTVPTGTGMVQQGNLPGVGLPLEQAVRGAMTMRGGSLERFDETIRAALEQRLNALRSVLLGRIRRGGPEKVVQRYQALLDTIDHELGRRVGLLIKGVQDRSSQQERQEQQRGRGFRVQGIDPESSQALTTELLWALSYGEAALRANVADLTRALQSAETANNQDAVNEITEQLAAARDELDEGLVRQIELRRQVIRQAAQERVDAAQFNMDWSTGLTGGLEAAQRIAGVRGAAGAAGHGGLFEGSFQALDVHGFDLRGMARADSAEGMRQRAATLATSVLAGLGEQRAALQGQFGAAWQTGDAGGVRAAALALQQNANDLANAVAESAELIRDAALLERQEVVQSAGHRTNLGNLAVQRLELEQRLAGTYEQGGAQRAALIRSTVVPALEAELRALTQQREEQQRQGVGFAEVQATIEAEGAKANEILQAQLEANEATAENTEPLKEFTGTLGFEYRSQRLTDTLVGR